MTRIPIDGIDRALTRYRQTTTLAQITRHTPPLQQPTIIGTAGGDAHQLRGIPAIGRNVTGAIPGTSPHHAAR